MNGNRGILYILVGPKGSGKTYIGGLIERSLGIPFFRVEPVFKGLRRQREITDAEYIREGFAVVEEKLREMFRTAREVVIETTGTAEEFRRMIGRMEDVCTTVSIRLDVPPDLCLQRVRSRDASAHIPVSDEQVEWINRLAAAVQWDAQLVLKNVEISDEDILSAFGSIRPDAPSPHRNPS